jgi:branched-chain amino acid transport system ATP-binding protein
MSAGYGNKQVVFDVSFSVGKGEIALLIGGNGAGKSTLLKCIYGLIPNYPNNKVYFDNCDITNQKSSELINKGLVYIPQKDNCFEDLTVQENLEIAGITIKSKIELKKRIEYVYQTLPVLSENKQRTPFKMSGGERQLLALGMALLHKPKMILLDEPTAGLTPKNTEFILDKISELNQKEQISFLIVEHRIKEAIHHANNIIGLKFGKIASIINKEQISNNDNIYNSITQILLN